MIPKMPSDQYHRPSPVLLPCPNPSCAWHVHLEVIVVVRFYLMFDLISVDNYCQKY